MEGVMKRVLWKIGLVLLMAPPLFGSLGIDATVSGNQSAGRSTITTQAFSTTSANELLLAFISSDDVSGTNTIATSVSGAGLRWTLVVRTNVQSGTAEIWRAFAPAALKNVAVSAALSQKVAASITVMSFTGVDTSGTNGSGAIGAIGTGNANPGAPTAGLTTTRNNSWVIGVGNDWDTATPRTPGPNQTLVHQYLASVQDTYWVQRQNTPTATSGTLVTTNDTAPTGDRYNLSICEVLPATVTGQSWSISGTISPAAYGVGTLVTLSGAASATATADPSGNYSFPGLAAGSYTVTPSETGFTFSPASEPVTVSNASVAGVNFTATAIPTWTISGTIAPASIGSGTLVTLSGSPSGTATADTSGNYSFTGLPDGAFTVTPSQAGDIFDPVSQNVTVSGADVSGVNFTAQYNSSSPGLLYPDLSDIIPASKMSIVGTGSSRVFQYTHDTFNGGPGPLVIQPAYNAASGTYQGTQYIYSLNGGTWTLSKTIPVAGAFVFDAAHGHFHFPFTTYGLYIVGADGGPGTAVATSGKVSFCINDSFIYDPSLPNAGALGNLGSCSDPTSLRGLDIGAVDEYDQTDEGQSISLAGVPDGTYWLRAVVDPNDFLAESDKSNNETDVELTISGDTLQVLQTVVPTLPAPPSITLTSPAGGSILSGTVQLAVNTAATTGVQYLIDGQPLGGLATKAPYNVAWNTTTGTNGTHWLAAQTTGPTGRIGTSPVVSVTVSNTTSLPPVVQLTSPTAGSTVSASIVLSATVASSQTISTVSFYVNGVQVGTSLTAPPYNVFWDTQTAPGGSYEITVSATDVTGNTGTSSPVSVTVDNSHPPNIIGKDFTISVDGKGLMQTPVFSTTTPGDLLVAFVAYDGPSGSPQTATVSGAGLSWMLVERSNFQSGTAEIWAAVATDPLSSVAVMAQCGVGTSYHGSLTVIAFTNASGPGIVGRTAAPSGAPDIPLPGVSAGNWVFAVGNDWDNAIARAPVSGQVLVHQRVDTQVDDTYWVQSTVAPSTAYDLVDIHDSSPTTDQWNYAAIEIVAAPQ
jgi:hypothetical protein